MLTVTEREFMASELTVVTEMVWLVFFLGSRGSKVIEVTADFLLSAPWAL